MALLLQISDTHFGTAQKPVMQALVQLVRTQAPDVLILSGDITQRARRRQFKAAAAYIDTLGIAARVIVPGNHDVPLFNVIARMFSPYGNFRRAFGNELEPELETAELLVLSVNSTRPKYRKDGAVDTAQIDRVAARLHAASPRQLRLVVMHHPVCAITGSDTSNLAKNHDAAIRCWSDAGADLILGGHIHLPYVLPLNTTAHPLSRSLWAVQAGTAVSSRTRGDVSNSCNILRMQADAKPPAVCVERWDYQAQTDRFALADTTTIITDRTGS